MDMGYYHVATEVWLNSNSSSYIVCQGGEDPNCSDSLSNPLDWSADAHTDYFNIYTGCDPRGSFAETVAYELEDAIESVVKDM